MARKRRRSGKKSNIKFVYTCANCGSPARKKALKALPNWKTAKKNEFGGLGTWRCTGSCRGKVTVSRTTVNLDSQQVERKAA